MMRKVSMVAAGAALGATAATLALQTTFLAGSPLRFVGNITVPIQLIHGEKDARVPLSQAVAFMADPDHPQVPWWSGPLLLMLVIFLVMPRSSNLILFLMLPFLPMVLRLVRF